jgi:hypothetical protein
MRILQYNTERTGHTEMSKHMQLFVFGWLMIMYDTIIFLCAQSLTRSADEVASDLLEIRRSNEKENQHDSHRTRKA